MNIHQYMTDNIYYLYY